MVGRDLAHEYGGRGLGIFEWLIFEEEYYRARGPKRVSQNGIFLLAPTMLEYGTTEQKARYLPPMASRRRDLVPGLVGARCRERPGGDPQPGRRASGGAGGPRATPAAGVLTGQKTWCSRGAFAEWCFAIFRTDPDAERHRGLTYFLVPMDAPGVTVRPIPQLDGETGFAEVFFEDVAVSDDQVLGGVGEGWKVAMSTAGSERGLSLRSPARYTEAAGRLLDSRGAARRTLRRVVGLRVHRVGSRGPRRGIPVGRCGRFRRRRRPGLHRRTGLRAVHLVDRLQGDRGSSGRRRGQLQQDLLVRDRPGHPRRRTRLLGPSAELLEARPGAEPSPGEWLDGYLFALAGPIYAGTNEIQRNVVAERLLGLPR